MSTARAWLLACITILTTVIFAAGLFKVAGTMVFIIEEFGLSMTAAGMLMSANGIAATIISLPGGGIMQKIGPRRIVLAALAIIFIGNAAGALSNSYATLLTTRFIEGVGFGLMGLAAPPIINALFPPEKRGLPMGIWSLWVSFGSMFILNMANVITPNFGWRGNWWLVAGLAVVFFIIFGLTVRLPSGEQGPRPGEVTQEKSEAMSLGKVLMTPGPWCLAIGFFAFAIANGSLQAFYPTYLQESLGMDPARANTVTSIANMTMIIGGILTGYLLTRIPNRNHSYFYFIIWIIFTIASIVQYNIPTVGLVVPFMIVYGIICQSLPPTILNLAPEAAATPAMLPIAMGVIMFGQSIGGILTNIICGRFVDVFGSWGALAIPIGICCLAATITAGLMIPIMKKKYASLS